MNEQELTIKINTLANTIGLEKTAAALEGMAVKAQAAGNTTAKTGQKVAQAGQQGADGLNVMSVATAAMQGNFQAAASAAVPLLEKSKAVGLSMTQLSLAGAALTAVVAGLRAISEWADAAAQRIAKIQMDNLTNKVNSAAAAYDKLLESMQKASAQNDATLAYNNAMIDAYTRQALALNELAKQRELATTTDEATRQEIEAKYSAKGAAISGMADTQKESNERQRSMEREAELLSQLDASKKRENELIEEAMALSRQTQNASSTARGSIGFMGFLMGGKKATYDAYQGMATQGASRTQEAIDKANAETARREQLETERTELLRMRNVSGINARTGAVSRDAALAAASNSAADRARANQEAIYQSAQGVDEALSSYSEADQRFVTALLQSAKSRDQLTNKLLQDTEKWLRDNQSRERNR
jgi:hypothetical protein